MRPEDHPAKFSAPILAAIAQVLRRRWAFPGRKGAPIVLLDPFAGIGGIHSLRDHEFQTIGVEIEPEWAHVHPGTMVGDALDLAATLGGGTRVDAVVTSPCYGNRMADTYDGSNDTCTVCEGTGTIDPCPLHADEQGNAPHRRLDCPDGAMAVIDESWIPKCERCGGSGKASTTRYTYSIALGRKPSDGSAAVMQWGRRYREFHTAAARQWLDVVRPGGLIVVNMSDHVRDQRLQGVPLWWSSMLGEIGLPWLRSIPVETRRNGNGENREARADVEWLLVHRRP